MAFSKTTNYWNFMHVLVFCARVTIFCDWVNSESVGLGESDWHSFSIFLNQNVPLLFLTRHASLQLCVNILIAFFYTVYTSLQYVKILSSMNWSKFSVLAISKTLARMRSFTNYFSSSVLSSHCNKIIIWES